MKAFKISLAFLCAFSLFSSLAFAQAAPASSDAPAQTAVAQSLPDESTLPILDTPAANGGPGLTGRQGPVSGAWIFFRMIFVLVVAAACIYLFLSFMRKKMGGGAADDDTFLRKVAQVTIAPGKSVQIVTLLEHAYLIGVTDNSIDLLGEISDKELVDAMNLNADRNQERARARNFNEVLSLFLNPKNPGATEGERKAASSLTDFFKKQKEKFGNGK